MTIIVNTDGTGPYEGKFGTFDATLLPAGFLQATFNALPAITNTTGTGIVDVTDGIDHDTAPDVDITQAGAFAYINGAVFGHNVINSGTGNFDDFLQVQQKGNNIVEFGFNGFAADASNPDINASNNNTHPILLSNIAIVTQDGKQYYQFLLDANESNGGFNKQISLDTFKISLSTNGQISSLSAFNALPVSYDMDKDGNVSTLFTDAFSAGSGKSDLSVLVPVDQLSLSGVDPSKTYLYLDTRLGYAGVGWDTSSTFEEWRTLIAAHITGTKFNDIANLGTRDVGEAGLGGFTLYIDADGNNKLDAGEQYVITAADGSFDFGSLSSGTTYTIREVLSLSDTTLAGGIFTTGFLAGQAIPIPAGAWQETTGTDDPAGGLVNDMAVLAGSTGVLIGNHSLTPDFTVVKTITSVDGGVLNGNPSTAPNASVNGTTDVIHYQVVLVNTGEVALTNVVLSDLYEGAGFANYGNPVQTGGNGSNSDAIFDKGETWTYSWTHTVTQAELDSSGGSFTPGQLTNTANASAKFNSTTLNRGPSTVNTPLITDPQMVFNKVITGVDSGVSADGSVNLTPTGGVNQPGDVIHYSITLHNTGNVTLTGVVLTDLFEGAVPGSGFSISGPVQTGATGTNTANLDVGETWTWTADYTVKATDISGYGGSFTPGFLTNNGDAYAFFGGSKIDVADVTVNTPIYDPQFTLVKTIASIDGGVLNGAPSTAPNASVDGPTDVIHYQVVLHNTGHVALTNIVLTDLYEGANFASFGTPVETGAVGTNTAGVLDVGETWTYSWTHTVTQAELDANGGPTTLGQLTNTADATAKFGTQTIDVPESTVNTPLITNPKMEFNKVITEVTGGVSADGSSNATASGGVDSIGDVIHYSITLHNTGNVTLTNVVLSDMFEGQSFPSGLVFTSLTATESGATGTNTAGALDVGETWTWTATYTAKAADFANPIGGGDAKLTNIGDATAKFGNATIDVDAVTVNTPVYVPKISVDKVITSVSGGVLNGVDSTAANASVNNAGDKIFYDIIVKNEGTVALTNVAVSDKLEGLTGPTGFTIDTGTPPLAQQSGLGDHTNNILEVGEIWTYKASYVVQQSDLDSNGGTDGKITNVATVTSKFGTTDVAAGPDSVDTPLITNPKMEFNKVITEVTGGVSADGSSNTTASGGVDSIGDVIHYSITLHNTGNVTLTNVVLSDLFEGQSFPSGLVFTSLTATESGATGTNTVGALDVGETWTWTATYTAKAADFANPIGGGDAKLTNTGDASAKFGNLPVEVDAVTVNTPVYVPGISIDKVITSVTDGVDVNSTPLNTADDSVNGAGDKIFYDIVVKNTGSVALTNVVVSDKLEGLTGPTGFTIDPGTPPLAQQSGLGDHSNNILEVGEIWTYKASYIVQQSDLNSNGNADGKITNTASVTSKFGTTDVAAGPASVNTPLIVSPGFTIDKNVESVTNGFLNGTTWIANSVGDVINYTVTVVNTGNVDLTKSSVTDTLEGAGYNASSIDLAGQPVQTLGSGSHSDNILQVGEKWVYTFSYTLTADDLTDAATHTRTATNDDIINNFVTATFGGITHDDSTATPIANVDLTKYVSKDGTSFVDANSDNPYDSGYGNVTSGPLYFKVTVENTGAVALTGVVVSDVNTTGASVTNLLFTGGTVTPYFTAHKAGTGFTGDNGNGILDVGEKWTFVYTESLDLGKHVNTAYVTDTQGAEDNDLAKYFGISSPQGPGVRTPGFWSNWQNIWDGDSTNDPKQVTQHAAGFPTHDILPLAGNVWLTDTNHDGKIDHTDTPTQGLLIGDYNMDGITDNNEDTLFVTLSGARNLVNASDKTIKNDGVQILGRDMIATWLNYLEGNHIDNPDNPNTATPNDALSPKHFINDAIAWMQQFASDKTAADIQATYNAGHAAQTTSSTNFSGGSLFPGMDSHSASLLHSELDFYNNTGGTYDPGNPADIHQFALPAI